MSPAGFSQDSAPVHQWHYLRRQGRQPLLDYIHTDEWMHTSLSAQIGNCRRFYETGRLGDARIWVRQLNRKVTGVMYMSNSGVVLPAYNPKTVTFRDEQFLSSLLRSRSNRLFSFMGMADLIQHLESAFGEHPSDFENYRILTHKPLPDSCHDRVERNTQILKAYPSDLERLWPLERAYRIEEVLRAGNRLNERAAKRHFLDALREQLVYYAVNEGRVVAKAGTNAQGRHFCQVGGVFVVPEQRRRGFAGIVMRYLMQKIANQGKSSCLFVKTTNSAALGLYAGLKFQDRGEFRISYWN